MAQLARKIWVRLQHMCGLETDSPSQRRRRATLVMIVVLSVLTGVVAVINTYIQEGVKATLLIPLLFTVVMTVALGAFFITKKDRTLVYAFLSMILVTPAGYQWSLGGFSAQGSIPIIAWSLVAPFGALMFQGSRSALRWFAAYLLLVIIALSLDGYAVPYADVPIQFQLLPVSHAQHVLNHGLNLIFLSLTLFAAMYYFVTAFQREHDRAEALVRALTKANHQLETAMNELKATQVELVESEKMAALGKLAAGFAHEINTPIGALKSTTTTNTQCVSRLEQLIAERDVDPPLTDDPSYQRYVRILKDNSRVVAEVGDRVAGAVSSFVRFARLDQASFDRVDIHEGLKSALAVARPALEGKATVDCEFGDVPSISCYPADLNQLFMNLINLAVDSMDAPGRITIRTCVKEGSVHVQIQDTGRGLTSKEVQQLFEPTFARSGERMKSSLGLFASLAIVQKHEGNIRVDSAEGEGTTITVMLPTNLQAPKR